ncbi:MAG TPA: PepSY domain-containing protein, partial [Candidatus Gallacutalibacter pullistercoris]|nr:PepSY domain-containing protein [Candidatus Gallacutalibacter pullistercoris]
MKKTTLKNKTIAVTAAALSLAVLAGCVSSGSSPAAGSVASDPSSSTQNQAMGTILLSVNPEIEIDYDDGGRVLEIEGLNEEGKAVIKDFTGYEGQACRTVVEDLVEEIYADGYFDSTVGGHTKNIVVKLEEGSRYPDDDFLEDVAEGVRGAVKTCHLDSSAMTVNEDDYAENGYIGLDKAKELVLGQLGLEEASFTEREYELDDGVYELEFTANGVEYEFEVNAVTGKVTEADYDHNDDWKDYDDDDNDDRDDDDDRYDDDDDDNDDRYDDDDDDNDDRYDDDDDDDRYDDDDDDRYDDDDDDRYD